MPLPSVTLSGNLTADPELRFTPSGAAVLNFTVACNERYQKDGQWVDGESIFIRCNVWRDKAELGVDQMKRGQTVIVTGSIYQREYEVEGQKRYSFECKVREMAVQITPTQHVQSRKVERTGGFAGPNDPPPPAEDPWGSAPPPSSGGGFADEPPF